MFRDLFRVVAAGVVAVGFCLLAGTPAVQAQARQEPPPKPEPVVIKLVSAQKGRVSGQEVLMVGGIDALSGKQRTFAVENQAPQNPNTPPKYDPNPGIKEEIEKVKPGEYLKVEPKRPAQGNYGGGYGRAPAAGVEWIDNAEPYIVAEHEEEPGAFLFDGAYEEKLEGGDVYKIELIKMGRTFACLAPMIKDGKMLVPDPAIVALGEELMKKQKEQTDKGKLLVEATINPQGNYLFVTSIDGYQAPRYATLTKITEAEIDGAKAPAIELSENGSPVTLVVAGKMIAKRWVADPTLLSAAKRIRPGSPVVFKTREVDEKTYVRAIAPAPKESPKKEEMKK